MGETVKGLFLLDVTKREKLRKEVLQNFQSCTFNHSVTSPSTASLVDDRRTQLTLP
jgi:hypothetical protein